MNDGLKAGHRRAILEILRAHPGVEKTVLFGSRAMGTFTPESDVDICLYGESLTLTDQGRLAVKIENLPIPQRVDLLLHRAIKDKALLDHIQREGKVLFERGGDKADVWQSVPFGRLLAEPVRNGIYKQKEFHGRGAKIVNMGEIFAHPRLRSVPMKRVELSVSERERFTLAKGDLLFARRSLVAEGAGKCSVVLDIDEPTTFESSIIRARPDGNCADPLFIYYFFNSTPGLHGLDTIRRQVAVAGITGSDLSRLEIPVPPLSEQRAISHILGTLDDKIELNRRMSETLEAMARALFKSWFVDFDPVRAKAEGRDTGLPKHIADLFPDSFADSELGEIPKGWEVWPFADTVEIIGGGTPKTSEPEYWNGDIPWFSVVDA
ncbi:MAG: restriction endonuclease subunit S, partial [Deltaproteobacteria bacterium]|nr:restriction endonuclease subunit S [Deltaproteobacteria bacterium]